MSKRNDADLVVVGGGPAGLAMAIGARREGLRTILLDRARPPIDKACGEGLMPDGVKRLRELGIELDAVSSAPFHGIRYVDGKIVAEGSFAGSPGLGMRRTLLHAALVRRAESVGVDLRWGLGATGIGDGALQTERGALRARWFVAADGLHSRLRQKAGLEGRRPRWPRYGLRRHYAVEPWTDRVEVHWAERAEAYVTPVGPRSVGVAFLWSGGGLRFDDLLERFPVLCKRLRGQIAASSDRGAGPLQQRVRAVVRGNLALVGDASGYVDALTGEGLSLAFHQAAALNWALRAGDLQHYARAHRRIAAMPKFITRLLLLVERHPRLRRRIIAALADDPVAFSLLIGLLVRTQPAARTLVKVLPSLLFSAVFTSRSGRRPRRRGPSQVDP